MNSYFFILCSLLVYSVNYAPQVSPSITSWLINTTGITGQHYLAGNPTPILDTTLANISNVEFSANWVYATTQ